MLFAIKNRLGPTLLLLVGLVALSTLLHYASAIPWRLASSPALVREFALGLGAILVSDGLVQGTLWLLFRERYRAHFLALAEYFQPQGPLEIAVAGLLAGGEELFFRGVLLAGLIDRAGIGLAGALALSALAFGALHLIPQRRLAPFALWAVWEGGFLGAVYLAFGSLLVSVLVHATHDVIGFTVFAWLRRAASSA